MIKKIIISLLVIGFLASVYEIAYDNSGGRTSATQKPGSTYAGCNCHGGQNAGLSNNISASDMTLGTNSQNVTYTISPGGSGQAGFDLAVEDAAGFFIPVSSGSAIDPTNGEAYHTTPQALSSGSASWEVKFVPTVTSATDITFYAAGKSNNVSPQWNYAQRTINITGSYPIGTVISPASNGYNLMDNFPINQSDPYSRFATIYPVNRLGTAGTISKIGFFVGKESNVTGNMKIYMKHTFSEVFALPYTVNNEISGATLVYNGTPYFSWEAGWAMIDLDTPFDYNGTEPVEVIIFNDRGGSAVTDNKQVLARYSVAVSMYWSNTNNGNVNGVQYQIQPNARFYKTSPPPAPTNASTTSITKSSMVVNWTPSAGTTDGYRVVFKQGGTAPANENDGGFATVPGTASNTYTITGLQAGTQYSVGVFSTSGTFFSSTAATASGTTTAITNQYTFTNEQNASLILGQPNTEFAIANNGGLSGSSMFGPGGMLISGMDTDKKIYVCDKGNNRVLVFNSSPTANMPTADFCIGQPNFSDNTAGTIASKLNRPSNCVVIGDRIYVADGQNHRIMIWELAGLNSGQSANYVFGQPDFMSGNVNHGLGFNTCDATSLYLTDGAENPNGMATDGTKLIVCDGFNNRVLIWNDLTFLTNNKPPDVVIGQPNFTTKDAPNFNASTAATLYNPTGVDVTKDGKLVISSTRENRILIYNTIPTTNGASADIVLGQTNFTDNAAIFTPDANVVYHPLALSISKNSGKLAVSTDQAGRIMIWDAFPTTNNAPATTVLARPNLTASSGTTFSNENGTNAAGFFAYNLAWAPSGSLYVSDVFRHGILRFDGGDTATRGPQSLTAGTSPEYKIPLSINGTSFTQFAIAYKYGPTPPTDINDPTAEVQHGVMGTSYDFIPAYCGTTYSFRVYAEKPLGGFGQYEYSEGSATGTFTSGAASNCEEFPIQLGGGQIYAVVPSVTGDTTFIGGNFTGFTNKAGTTNYTRNGLAAINTETGAVLEWTCNLNANQTVKSIVIDKSGSSLYIGGDFTTIGGVNKTNLAKISTAGVVDAGFTTPNINASVGDQGGTCMVLNKGGDTLFMTGNFTDINGNARKNLAAVKTSDGSLTNFNPADFYLQAATCRFILLSKDGYSLYLGSNTNGLNLKSVNIATGTDVGEFDFQVDGGLVACGEIQGNYLYLGGAFTTIMGNSDIQRLAKIDISGPTPVLVTTFNNGTTNRPDGNVRRIFTTSNSLYIVGEFNNIGGTVRTKYGAVSTTNGAVQSWNPNYPAGHTSHTIQSTIIGTYASGKLYLVGSGTNNFNRFSAVSFTPPATNVDGTATMNVGSNSTSVFSNSAGILAKLTTGGSSNMGSTNVIVAGSGGDTSTVNGFVVLERYLQVDPTTQPGSNVTVQFFVPKSEMDAFAALRAGFGNAGNNYSGCRIHRLSNSGTYIETFIPTITIDGETVIISFSTPGFSKFYINDTPVLPVELASFTSSVNKNNVDLKWSTVSEQNNKGFEIERKKSNEGSQWQTVTFVEGKGTTNQQQNYTYADRNLQTGSYNYRLKQIDYNGNYQYYELNGTIEVGIPKEFDLSQNYPNPFNPSTKINYQLPKDAFVKINVYDLTGRLVSTLMNTQQAAGYYSVEFNSGMMNGIASGVYFYRIEAADFVSTKRMVLVK